MMKKKIRGSASLVFATIIWGSAFVAQSVGMDYIGPFTFQAARCALAVLILLVLSAFSDRRHPEGGGYIARWTDKQLWKSGILCGIPLFLAVNLQQVALLYTAPGKAGFLTAMYIIIVPMIDFLLGKKISVLVPVSVAIAVGGLYLLCGTGDTTFQVGDLLLIACAFMFSVQITVIDRCPSNLDSLRLNGVQFFVCTILSAIVMLLREQPTWEMIRACAIPLGYAGILSSGIAYSLQITGQRDLEASTASLLMSLESVFAAVFGWLILRQLMSSAEISGSLFVFAAVILSQLPCKRQFALH